MQILGEDRYTKLIVQCRKSQDKHTGTSKELVAVNDEWNGKDLALR